MANEYWLSHANWAVIEPLIPMNRCGVKPENNLVVISGILSCCRQRDPAEAELRRK